MKRQLFGAPILSLLVVLLIFVQVWAPPTAAQYGPPAGTTAAGLPPASLAAKYDPPDGQPERPDASQAVGGADEGGQAPGSGRLVSATSLGLDTTHSFRVNSSCIGVSETFGQPANYFVATGDWNTPARLPWVLVGAACGASLSGNYRAGVFNFGQVGFPTPGGVLVADRVTAGSYSQIFIDFDRDGRFGEAGEGPFGNGQAAAMPDGNSYTVTIGPNASMVSFASSDGCTSGRASGAIAEDFGHDVFAGGSWTRTDGSVYVSGECLQITSDGGSDDAATKAVSLQLPITVEARMRLISGGNDYFLPSLHVEFGNNWTLDGILTTYNRINGWGFGHISPNLPDMYRQEYTGAPTGETQWFTVRETLRADGGVLQAKADGAADFQTVATRTWSIPGTITRIRLRQNWDAFCQIDYVSVVGGATATVDLSVDAVSPVQVLEGQPLVRDKSTAVKVIIRKSGNGTADNVSVRLNYGSSDYTIFYVAEPANMNEQHVLRNANTTFPLSFPSAEITRTIYFFDSAFKPLGNSYQVSATVDYLAVIGETDETNNTIISPLLQVYDTKWGELFSDLTPVFFPTDWASGSALTFDSYYIASRDFLLGTYPLSGDRFKPLKHGGSVVTTSSRGADGRLDGGELALWANLTAVYMRLAHLDADGFVAMVPPDWFQSTTVFSDVLGLHYNGVVFELAKFAIAEGAVTGAPNGSAPGTVSHEIGHMYGLGKPCEEYDENCDSQSDRTGNPAAPGLWVDMRIPIQASTDRQIYCFMGGAESTFEYWVDSADFSKLLNDHRTSGFPLASMSSSASQVILVVGTIDISGSVTLDNWYVLPDADLDVLSPGPYVFEYQTGDGTILFQQSFGVDFTSAGPGSTIVPFAIALPYVQGTTKIVVKNSGIPKAERLVSSNSPTVTVIAPNGGETFYGEATIQWSGYDLDGDSLAYAVLYSKDNGAHWETIGANLVGNTLGWDVSQLPSGSQYLMKVIVTDGVNTGQDQSDGAFTIEHPVLSVSGPLSGYPQGTYTYSATLSAINAVVPVTYAWQALGQSPITHTGGLSDTALYSWSTAGTKLVTVTASNAAGLVSGTTTVVIMPIPTSVGLAFFTASSGGPWVWVPAALLGALLAGVSGGMCLRYGRRCRKGGL